MVGWVCGKYAGEGGVNRLIRVAGTGRDLAAKTLKSIATKKNCYDKQQQ